MNEYFWINIVIFLTLALAALNGWRRGLIMTLAGLVTLIVALVGAHYISITFSHYLESFLEPRVADWVANRVSELNITFAPDLAPVADATVFETIRAFGISESLADTITGTVTNHLQQHGSHFQAAITTALTASFARMIVYVVAFLAIIILMNIAMRLLDAVAKLPILNLVNTLGGLVGGLIQGGLLVWIVVYILRLMGVLTAMHYEGAVLLRVFY